MNEGRKRVRKARDYGFKHKAVPRQAKEMDLQGCLVEPWGSKVSKVGPVYIILGPKYAFFIYLEL